MESGGQPGASPTSRDMAVVSPVLKTRPERLYSRNGWKEADVSNPRLRLYADSMRLLGKERSFVDCRHPATIPVVVS